MRRAREFCPRAGGIGGAVAKRGRKTKEVESRGRRAVAPDDRWVCPAHLDVEAERAWDHVVRLLDETGNLARTDPVAVEAYAINVAMMREAHRTLRDEGLTIDGSHGGKVAHPAVGIADRASGKLRGILRDLGLVPGARVVGVQGESAGDLAEEDDGKWGGVITAG